MNGKAPASVETREVWGVLGGMGPLASTEFLRTIYEYSSFASEQDAPIVILLSDPTVPDRTENFLNGNQHLLLERLVSGLEKLAVSGATAIVVCCITIHPLIPLLPPHLRNKTMSLVDSVFQRVLETDCRHLLICTDGARALRIFENHEHWKEAARRIILPEENDQALAHEMLYGIKTNRDCRRQIHLINELMCKYEVASYIAGCTEMHILAKEQARASGRPLATFCVDPLELIAAKISLTQPSKAQPRAGIGTRTLAKSAKIGVE